MKRIKSFTLHSLIFFIFVLLFLKMLETIYIHFFLSIKLSSHQHNHRIHIVFNKQMGYIAAYQNHRFQPGIGHYN